MTRDSESGDNGRVTVRELYNALQDLAAKQEEDSANLRREMKAEMRQGFTDIKEYVTVLSETADKEHAHFDKALAERAAEDRRLEGRINDAVREQRLLAGANAGLATLIAPIIDAISRVFR